MDDTGMWHARSMLALPFEDDHLELSLMTGNEERLQHSRAGHRSSINSEIAPRDSLGVITRLDRLSRRRAAQERDLGSVQFDGVPRRSP